MGTSNSCLPVSFNTFHTLCNRSSASKLEYDVQEAFNKNKNAININKVSEDELLLLPGINRQLAANIIQYRHINDGFKQIDDILKVDGITSNIFRDIYTDITIDISSSSNNKQELINLNFASYDDLCLVPGLTPNLVKRIIERREKKGSYRFIEDLLKIKGINYIILATVHPHVTVENSISTNNCSVNNLDPLLNQTTTTDTLSLASILLETLPPELQTILVSSLPQRPSSIHTPQQKTFRFASWNLQQLTNDKVQNPGVREVICRVILENNLSLIGIQEIGNKESLDLIIQELNNPTIPSLKDWPNRHQGKWNYTISDISGHMYQNPEYLGYLYDESIGIELKQSSLFTSKQYFTRSPYITLFRIYDKFEFVFINIHFKSKKFGDDKNNKTKDEAKTLAILIQAIKDTIEQKYVIIFGSFNIIPTVPEFEALVKCNYSYMIKQNTDINLKNLEGSTCFDNIWLSAPVKALSTGNSGVIREKLSSLWIPVGWKWGGLVSDHCPIWTEFDLS